MFNCYGYNQDNNDFRYLYGSKNPIIELKDGVEIFLDGIEAEKLILKIINNTEYNVEYLDYLKTQITENVSDRLIDTIVECIQMFFSILIYSQLNQDSIIRQTRTHTKKIQSKKDKRASKKPKIKLIKQNIIRLNTDHIQLTDEEIKHYERRTLGWTVRGHWRTYQSGKKIWIKPQTRGDKDNVQGKTYEI